MNLYNGIGSFDVISVTEKFATENPELVQAFMDATAEANEAFSGTDEEYAALAEASGMNVEAAKAQVSGFIIPTVDDQKNDFFNEGGLAASASASLSSLDDAARLALLLAGGARTDRGGAGVGGTTVLAASSLTPPANPSCSNMASA